MKKKILNEMVDSLSSLGDYGFSCPIIREDGWFTCIDCFHESIGIEIEIDWRESDLFVLIVKLDSGKLPSGYYVSEGVPCRRHIQEVIYNNNWNISIKQLKGRKKEKFNSEEDTMYYIINKFFEYRKVIDACIEKIISESYTLF